MTTTPRKHNPAWKDNTRQARALKRQSQDDTWASTISGGKYTTLRKLMTAIHKGEIVLFKGTVEHSHSDTTLTLLNKKGKQS